MLLQGSYLLPVGRQSLDFRIHQAILNSPVQVRSRFMGLACELDDFLRLRFRFSICRDRLRREQHAHRNHIFDRVALAVHRHRHLNARIPDRFRTRVETHLGGTFRIDVGRARRRAIDREQIRIERLDRDCRFSFLRELAVDDGAEECFVADGQESRERGREQQRLVDANLALA